MNWPESSWTWLQHHPSRYSSSECNRNGGVRVCVCVIAGDCSSARRARRPAALRRHVVHCDIKPSNLLLRPDGSLCFCDFEGVAVEGHDRQPTHMTDDYLNPRRAFHVLHSDGPLPPGTKSEDVYAAAVTAWEIHTGRTRPEDALGHPLTLDTIALGVEPDLGVVVDLDVRNTIKSLMDQGRGIPVADIPIQGRQCTRRRVFFRGCKGIAQFWIRHVVYGTQTLSQRCPRTDKRGHR